MKDLLIPLLLALSGTGCDHSKPSHPADLVPPAPQVAAAPAAKNEPGWTERDLTVRNLEGGGEVKLSSFAGKYVFLDFWATWCGPCIEAIPTLNTLEERFGPKGLAVAGVSVDDEKTEEIAKFAKTNRMNYRVFHGDDSMIDRFGKSRGLPTAFLLDPDGRVIQKFVGEYPAARLIADVEAALAKGGAAAVPESAGSAPAAPAVEPVSPAAGEAPAK